MSLKELLDENFERLQKQPFKDPRTQFEMLELIGGGYQSLGLYRQAVHVYELALSNIEGTNYECDSILIDIAISSTDSGQLEVANSILKQIEKCSNTNPDLLMDLTTRTHVYHLTTGQLKISATTIARGLSAFDTKNPRNNYLKELLIARQSIKFNSATAGDKARSDGTDLLAILMATGEKNIEIWNLLSRPTLFSEDENQVLARHLYPFKLAWQGHEFTVSKSIATDQLVEFLLRVNRFEEASRLNRIGIVSSEKLLALDPESVRNHYQLAQAKTRQGEILQAVGQAQAADLALREAITALEPMVRDSNVVFIKSTLARAYLLAGRIDEARPLVRHLLELGWRRPDFFELAKAKGALPDPLPPPLELDLSLPPKVRAYIDSLPKVPPPWETATDLPTVEEILAVEEARLSITPPVH